MPIEHNQQTLHSRDGTTLTAQVWRPESPRAHLVVVPGYADHAARYRELAHNLGELGIATVAVDLRGHGHSSGKRGYIDAWGNYLDDVAAARGWLGGERHFLLGHSQGGTVALDVAAASPPAGLIVTNPFLAVAFEVPRIKVWAGKALGRIVPRLTMANEIDPAVISNDPGMVESYARDPLVFKVATARWFVESLAAQERVKAMREVAAPLLYIYSPADPLVSSTENARLAERIDSPDKTVWVRRGELHEVLNEVHRTALHRQIGEWIVARA